MLERQIKLYWSGVTSKPTDLETLQPVGATQVAFEKVLLKISVIIYMRGRAKLSTFSEKEVYRWLVFKNWHSFKNLDLCGILHNKF